MVYVDGVQHPSLVELARAGNFQAIAHWLNQALVPYGMRAYVGGTRPGCLKVLVELSLSRPQLGRSEEWRQQLIRFVCQRIWKLNSARIEGVRIAAKLAHERSVLWEQSVRVVSPARRLRKQQSQHLQHKLRQTAQQRSRLKIARSMLISGPPIFAFVFGCVLGFAKAPTSQTNAVASSSQPKLDANPNPLRSDTVQAALETVPVVKQTQVSDPNDPTVTLMFAGDVTLANAFTDAIGTDYDRAFAALNEYRQADLAMVNLEGPLTRATTPMPDKKFTFRADPDAVKVLTSGGVDLVNLANNHTMDYQEPGLEETIDTLDKAGINHVGAGRDATTARRPEIVDVKGQRVAYLGYYTGDFALAGDHTPGSNYADEQRIADDIKAIRNQVDWIIVNYHWGQELATHPTDWQVDLAHFTIDQGADVVVGHHPHVLQGAEIYKGRPIAYSMGNFVFGGNTRSDYDTAVLKVALKDRQMKVEFLPIEVKGFQPHLASSDRGPQILQQISDRSTSFQQPMQSPITLDARPNGSVDTAITAPAPGPSSATATPPATPSSSDTTTPTTASPAPSTATTPASLDGRSPTPQASPFTSQSEPAPAPSPDTATTAPGSPKHHSGFATKSTDSFISAPSHTPLNSIQPGPNTLQSNPTTTPDRANPDDPNAATSPPANDHSALPSSTQLSAVPSNPGTTRDRPAAKPIPSTRKTSAQAQRSHDDRWVASAQVGADLIPDVSLLGAMAW